MMMRGAAAERLEVGKTEHVYDRNNRVWLALLFAHVPEIEAFKLQFKGVEVRRGR
jgi:hypothetical protein